MLPDNTKKQLEDYVNLLLKWNKKINLISKKDEENIWERHINDSAQLVNFIQENDIVTDLGSGAGLPGIVISILKTHNINLVESDIRKSVFLNQAKNLSSNNIKIINDRIENCLDKLENTDIFTCRGLASIEKLLSFNLINKDSQKFLLLKGENYHSEIEEAKKNWSFDINTHPSITSKNSAILEIYNVRRKNKN